MEQLLALINEFEKRNNTSIYIQICGDGSCTLYEFWSSEEIKSFNQSEELYSFLSSGNLKMKDGRSVSPIEILN